MNRKFVIIAATFAALALPASASAACPVGIANDLSVVPPAELVEGQTQNHNFTVTACTAKQKVTVEWVRVTVSNKPWMTNASYRETIVAETVARTADTKAASGTNTYVGTTSYTVPIGAANGHYAVITRYYADGYAAAEAQGASSFAVMTPDVCPNIDGKQPTVPTAPAGLILDATGNCTVPPPPPIDVCPNTPVLDTVIPMGYTLIAGECKIIAKPTGETPQPLKPNPIIRKVANVRTVKTGGTIRYTITVKNAGPGVLLAAKTCDKIPAGTTYVSHTGGAAFANGSLCVKHGNMVKGKTVRFTITVKVSGSFKGRTVTNTACITSANAAKKCAKAVVKVKVIRKEPVGGVTG